MNPAIDRRITQAISCSELPGSSVRVLLMVSLAFLTACQSAPEYRNPTIAIDPASSITDEPFRNAALSESSLEEKLQSADSVTTHRAFIPESTEQASWLLTLNSDFDIARQLVEDELNVDLAKVTLQLVDDIPINAEVAHETQRLVTKQFGNTPFAHQFLNQVMSPLDGTYAAVYSARLGAVMISRSMLNSFENSLRPGSSQAARRAALMTLLIHELVHAADDIRFNIHDNRALNFRASFAQSATFEGHAQWVTRNICKKAGCSKGLTALDNFMFSTDQQSNQLTQPVEAISRSVLEYSYVEGERFVAQLAKRHNGQQLIDKVLRTPPLDPIQILAPETYPDNARELRNQQLILASRNVEHPLTSTPWIGVETSPLKGVDLRADPARRQAAIDGFTRLIQGMVSMQFYDQMAHGAMPIEATLLKAESAHTARLFANMLHSNTHQSGARVNDEPLHANDHADPDHPGIELHIYRTAIDADASYRTAIAVAGKHVVQVSGNITEQEFLDDYAIRVLLNLNNS